MSKLERTWSWWAENVCFSETLSINHLCMPGRLVRSNKRPVDFNTPEKHKREFLHGFILVFSRADGVLLALCMENELCRIPLQESLTQLDPFLKFFNRISASSTSRIENFKWWIIFQCQWFQFSLTNHAAPASKCIAQCLSIGRVVKHDLMLKWLNHSNGVVSVRRLTCLSASKQICSVC